MYTHKIRKFDFDLRIKSCPKFDYTVTSLNEVFYEVTVPFKTINELYSFLYANCGVSSQEQVNFLEQSQQYSQNLKLLTKKINSGISSHYKNLIRKKQLKKPAMNSKRDAWDKVSGIWNKAASFVKSQTSRLTEGKVDKQTRNLRILSCHGDENTSPCKYRSFSTQNKFHYCNLCGCGEREIARLSKVGSEVDKPLFDEEEYDKLDYPYLECPIKKPGFSNYEGEDKILRFE